MIFIFDFDGTLICSNDIKRNALISYFRAKGVSDEAVEDLYRQGLSRSSILRSLCKAKNKEEEHQSLLKLTSYIDKHVGLAPLYEGVEELLIEIKKAGHRAYISSATPRDSLETLLIAKKLHIYISGFYGGNDSKTERIVEIKKSFPNELVVVVGDGIDDYSSAVDTESIFFGVNEARHTDRPGSTITSLLTTFSEKDWIRMN